MNNIKIDFIKVILSLFTIYVLLDFCIFDSCEGLLYRIVMSEEFRPYLATISLKVVQVSESELFYDLLFEKNLDAKKDISKNTITYWGPVGLMISEQKSIASNPDPDYRLGFTQISIRVGSPAVVDQIYKEIVSYKYSCSWKPRTFDYSDGYYSTCLFDPDYNKIEVFYTK